MDGGVMRGLIAPVPRVAVTLDEAAASLGVSRRHFDRHVSPHLRIIRTGSARLVPVAELAKWAERSATLAGGS
jgi:excisionase family DNA binding protein